MTIFETMRPHFESLTQRQREIARLLVSGMTNLEVAGQLCISVHTIKAHRAEIMSRMQVNSFAELVNQFNRLTPPLPLTTPLHVIVVEDDEWYRDYLTDNLNERGYSSIGVVDGEGLRAAWAQKPADVVILDIELGQGKENGLALATRILSNCPCGIIMVTAKGAQDERLEGLSTGADAYFAKPVNIDELSITITNLARRLR
ncbi:response regulator [Gallionella capsiferriformans]|jgi:DNA-binding NarL/FixJ family response regulator|uniref:Two component transcriptional regulator, LuxR family n=1 Tax=Gallionella capsiferriformans (strain ES-2) TaxID=395494 RepID=D9SC96_GALCS|nr:response regulator [Gallionella capsiferriformans]ADL54561.1 two component transcriptional regulator, LuxR family [Gallionella capsiferriformans ES-2]